MPTISSIASHMHACTRFAPSRFAPSHSKNNNELDKKARLFNLFNCMFVLNHPP